MVDSVIQIGEPFELFHDIDGQPLEDGYIYIGESGLDPVTNPIVVYSDSALTLPVTQPIRTIAGYPVTAGTPIKLYIPIGVYSITVLNKRGTLIYTDSTVQYPNNLYGVNFTSIQAAADSDLSGLDVIKTESFYDGWAPSIGGPQGGGYYYRDGTNGAASTLYADNSGFYDINGVGRRLYAPYEIEAAQLGAVGDDSDESTELGYLFSFGAGKVIKFRAQGTYRSATSIVTQAWTQIELNGATLKFVVTGAENCLDLRDHTSVKNGAIVLAGSAYSGHGGNGCPIIVGEYGSGAGYSNIDISNISITSNKTGGNCVFITGDSHNITIDNVDIPSSANIITGISIHWGGATTPAAGTYHPYNIAIENITVGDLSYNNVDTSALAVSGAYNITAKNIDTGINQFGKTFYVYPGDYGAQYATTSDIQAKILTGLIFENINSSGTLVGGYFTSRNISGTIDTINADIRVVNCNLIGFDETNANCFGYFFVNIDGVMIEGGKVDAFLNNVSFATICNNIQLTGKLRLRSSYQRCIDFRANASYLYTNITISDCIFDNNNTQASAGRAAVWATYTRNLKLINNRFIEPDMYYSLRADNTCIDILLIGNLTESLSVTAAAYSIGSTTDYSINAYGHGNLAATGLTSTGGAPIFEINSRGNKQFFGSAAPASGTWIIGDKVWNSVPAAGAATGMGWVCTVAGTPGTWKAFGNIAV